MYNTNEKTLLGERDLLQQIRSQVELQLELHIIEGLRRKGFEFEDRKTLTEFILEFCNREVLSNTHMRECNRYTVNRIPFLETVRQVSISIMPTTTSATIETSFTYL